MSTTGTPNGPDDLEWLRQIRRKITEDFGHDHERIGDYLREREKDMGARIVRSPKGIVPVNPV